MDIHKGTNGRWRHALGLDDIRKFERLALEKLGADAAGWLAGGTLGGRALAA